MPDRDDYPTDEELTRVREWPHTDEVGWFNFINSIWHAADWGWKEENGFYYISTGGWSGNEEIITAMSGNLVLWSMTFWAMRRGGHYLFSLQRKKAEYCPHCLIGVQRISEKNATMVVDNMQEAKR